MDNQTIYRRQMNYYETDQMGIIHHSNYIRLFEEARLAMIEQFGIDYRKLEETGIIIPVLFVECKYLLPLHYKDEIEVHCRLEKFDGIKMEIAYEVFQTETGNLCTTGRTGHCFLDSEMKPFRMKRTHPKLYQKLMESVQNETKGVK